MMAVIGTRGKIPHNIYINNIVLYTLSVYSDMCQLILSKTEGKKSSIACGNCFNVKRTFKGNIRL